MVMILLGLAVMILLPVGKILYGFSIINYSALLVLMRKVMSAIIVFYDFV